MAHLDADAGSPAASTTQSVTTDAITSTDLPEAKQSTDQGIDDSDDDATGGDPAKRRRGSRGGQRRRTPAAGGQAGTDGTDDEVELPEPMSEGRRSVEAAERALVRRPKIGDTMPIPTSPPPGPARKPVTDEEPAGGTGAKRRKRRGSGGGRSGGGRPDGGGAGDASERSDAADGQIDGAPAGKGPAKRSRRTRRDGDRSEDAMDAAMLETRRGRERNGK